ncbi:MAG: GFA family protein [Gammaproteobacteria bacterium]|nr:GFA family protein [Gammaproteobacteria bacterium]
MTIAGGCYCGALRYEITGDFPWRALCLCKTCQKISGGAGNLFIGIEARQFRYTQGEPRTYRREGDGFIPTREFCGTCGVHIAGRLIQIPEGVVVKIGTLDDPSVFEGPVRVFWTQDKQPYHLLPADAEIYATLPGR